MCTYCLEPQSTKKIRWLWTVFTDLFEFWRQIFLDMQITIHLELPDLFFSYRLIKQSVSMITWVCWRNIMITAFHLIVRHLWSLRDQFQEIRQNRGIDLWQLHNLLLFSMQCSFLPRFSIRIKTKYFNDNGSIDNVSKFLTKTFFSYHFKL